MRIKSVEIAFDDLQENLNENSISFSRDEILATINAALKLDIPIVVIDESTSNRYRLIGSNTNTFKYVRENS